MTARRLVADQPLAVRATGWASSRTSAGPRVKPSSPTASGKSSSGRRQPMSGLWPIHAARLMRSAPVAETTASTTGPTVTSGPQSTYIGTRAFERTALTSACTVGRSSGATAARPRGSAAITGRYKVFGAGVANPRDPIQACLLFDDHEPGVLRSPEELA